MSLLRIHVSLFSPSLQCEWALTSDVHERIVGEGLLTTLPQHAARIQLILPASQVLITRAHVPLAARRNSGSILAYAIEDDTLNEPDTNQVSWLGKEETDDLLAVIDKTALQRWQHALEAAGIHDYEIHCETLMLPYTQGEWSMAWNGREGCVRTGEFEGAATDCGDSDHAPLALHLLLEEAKSRSLESKNAEPTAIVIYTGTNTETPDIKKWSHDLGIAVRYASHWDWRSAAADSGINLLQKSKNWRMFSGTPRRLYAAAWLVAAALLIHASALLIEQLLLTQEQQALHQQMEQRFREVFPDAVSVSDPALQMRRKIFEARNAAGLSDSSDFLAMIEPLATALKILPVAAVHIVTYDNGRMTVELPTADETQVKNIITALRQSGMRVEITSPSVLSVSAS